MALKKCKECGAEVSNKAKSCPKCGAPVKSETGCGTLILGIFLGLVVLGVILSAFNGGNSDSYSSGAASSSVSASSSSKIEPAKPKTSWSAFSSRDQMTNEVSAYATSIRIAPTRSMSFPYADVRAWLAVGCDGASEWAYIGFNESPNLTNDENQDGYNLLKTRVKWNENVVNTYFTQDWGAKFLHFRADKAAIEAIAESSSVMVEIPWYGQGAVNFRFPLDGSSAAIADMRSMCKK
jgi:hypothetical protein